MLRPVNLVHQQRRAFLFALEYLWEGDCLRGFGGSTIAANGAGERGVSIDPDVDIQAILLRVKRSRLDVPRVLQPERLLVQVQLSLSFFLCARLHRP